jgi:hypothetical protein
MSSPISESAADIFAEVVDFPIPPFPYRAICFIIRYGTGNNICYSDVYTILVVPILPKGRFDRNRKYQVRSWQTSNFPATGHAPWRGVQDIFKK